MKKILSLFLTLVLAFTLVACSTGNEETTTETTVETQTTVEESSTEETSAEEKDEPVEVTSVALKNGQVLVSAEGVEQQIVKLEAGNQDALVSGHKYVYETEKPEITDPLVVDEVEMLGKLVGAPMDTNLIDTLLEKVEGVKVVDTRSEQDFANGSIDGAISIPFDKLEELQEQAKEGTLDILSQFTNEDVILLIGNDTDSNDAIAQDLLYANTRVGAIINGRAYSDYKGQ